MPLKSGNPQPPQPPRGFKRLVFRAPMWCYRLGCGWLLGKWFLLLTHTGRTRGLPRQTVLEVVHHEPDTDTYFIASGYGKPSDWYRNLLTTPAVTIQVGRRKMHVMAHPLAPEESGAAMARYARRYPTVARYLCGKMGYHVDGSDDDYRTVGHEAIPIIALRQIACR